MIARYQKRWANGYWRVFDTHLYTTYSVCLTERECDKALGLTYRNSKNVKTL